MPEIVVSKSNHIALRFCIEEIFFASIRLEVFLQVIFNQCRIAFQETSSTRACLEKKPPILYYRLNNEFLGYFVSIKFVFQMKI